MSQASIALHPATTSATAQSVRSALARVESRRLLSHPLFLLGMVTSLAAIALSNNDANTP